MKLRLKLQKGDGEVFWEEADLKVKSGGSGERLLDAGRQYAKEKGLTLLGVQSIQPPEQLKKPKAGRRRV